ncbi:MAG: NfeD family protein [Lachnospiraceae bacterium]|nr:NfeD family protein [Lachnospiraceae bacterium]
MSQFTWLIAFIAFLGVELITIGLASIWFALGSLVALAACMLGANMWVQLILFVVVSAASMLLVRPFALRFVNKDVEKTNVEAVTGKTGKVTETINNIEGTGTVFIDGLEWTARTEDDSETIEKDTIVRVVRIEGVKAIVSSEK